MHGTLPDHVPAAAVLPSRRDRILGIVGRLILLGIGAWLGMVFGLVLALATGLTALC
jgi:hypothetical protein